MMETKNNYRTKDLAEAAILLVKNKKFLGIVRNDSVCWFNFEDTDGCQKIANDYLFGNCQVNAHSFYEEMKKLKKLIFRE